MTKAESFLFYGSGQNYDTENDPEFEPVFETNPTPEEEVSVFDSLNFANNRTDLKWRLLHSFTFYSQISRNLNVNL